MGRGGGGSGGATPEIRATIGASGRCDEEFVEQMEPFSGTEYRVRYGFYRIRESVKEFRIARNTAKSQARDARVGRSDRGAAAYSAHPRPPRRRAFYRTRQIRPGVKSAGCGAEEHLSPQTAPPAPLWFRRLLILQYCPHFPDFYRILKTL